jgi:hypothetical protein
MPVSKPRGSILKATNHKILIDKSYKFDDKNSPDKIKKNEEDENEDEEEEGEEE